MLGLVHSDTTNENIISAHKKKYNVIFLLLLLFHFKKTWGWFVEQKLMLGYSFRHGPNLP
jgi:hypothetical protein